MNSEYIQNIRYKLQKRYRKVNSVESQFFHHQLNQFWCFIQEHFIIKDILDDILIRYPEIKIDTEYIPSCNDEVFKNENTNVVAAYHIIDACIKSDMYEVEEHVGRECRGNRGDANESLESFKSLFVEPLYEYIDEQLDEQRAILNLLRRYKHKCEWFPNAHLKELANKDKEKDLSYHLYEFLYDQGLDFSIEPSSASGSPDLIASQNSEDPLIADVKVFDGDDRGKSYIVEGFNQIYTYTLNYNEPFGYLIIFKTCEKDIKFSLANETYSTPYVIHNNKTIFIITIDVCSYDGKTASKRGRLKASEIKEEDLIVITKEDIKESENISV